MKFICEKCQTRYSIADDKVRQKVVKIRCKTCGEVITVQSPLAGAIVLENEFEAQPTQIDPRVLGAPALPVPAARPVLPISPTFAKPAAERAPAKIEAPAAEWHLSVDGQQEGPYGKAALARRILELKHGEDLYVWREDFDGWKPPAEVPDVAKELAAEKARRLSASKPPAIPAAARTGPKPIPGPKPVPSPKSGLSPLLQPRMSPLEAAVARATPVEAVAAHRATPPPGGRRPTPLPASLFPASGLDSGNGAPKTPLARLSLASVAPGSAPLAAPFPTGTVTPRPFKLPLEAPAPRESSTLSSVSAVLRVQKKMQGMKLVVGLLAVVVIVLGLFVVAVLNRSPSQEAAPAPAAPEKPKLSPEEIGAAVAERLAAPEAGKPTTVRVEGPTAPHVTAAKRPIRAAPNVRAPTEPPPVKLSAADQALARRMATEERSTGPGLAAPAPKAQVNMEAVSRVVRSNQGAIKICYERALMRDKTLTSGKMEVTVSIGVSGRVKGVTVKAPSEFRLLEPCIREAVSRWAFPAAGDEYDTSFPLVLSGSQ